MSVSRSQMSGFQMIHLFGQVNTCTGRNQLPIFPCTSVLILYKGATLVIYRAHGPYTLVGPCSELVYTVVNGLRRLITTQHSW